MKIFGRKLRKEVVEELEEWIYSITMMLFVVEIGILMFLFS